MAFFSRSVSGDASTGAVAASLTALVIDPLRPPAGSAVSRGRTVAVRQAPVTGRKSDPLNWAVDLVGATGLRIPPGGIAGLPTGMRFV
jgi:hypothetical protein